MRQALWSWLVVGVGGCGEASGVALDDVPAAFASAYCERVFACCDETELRTLLGAGGVTDRPSCEAYVARVFGNEFVSDTMRALDRGRAGYDPVAMETCVEHVRADGCEHLARTLRLMTLPADCPAVRPPRIAIGGACDHDFQCGSDLCAASGEHADGTCEPVPAADEPCVLGDCGPSAYCDRTSSTDGRCTAIERVGSSCTSALGCESLVCDSGTCGAPLCDGR